MTLTPKQRHVFKFICDFFKEFHFCPSYKEIAKQFNFSSDGTVRTYLEYFEKKGYIQRNKKARSIKLLHNPFDIPIIGRIQAGIPLEAVVYHSFCNLVKQGF